jgi:hypothetical protein
MPSVRCRFITTDSFVSAAIRRLTGSLFSHVEFGTPEGTWIGAHLSGGVQERPAGYCRPTREYYYEVPCTALQQDALLRWARSKIGTKYNVRTIIGLAIQARRMTSLHRMICSQFFSDGMLLVFGSTRYLNVLPGWTYRITPETAHLSPLLTGHLIRRVG